MMLFGTAFLMMSIACSFANSQESKPAAFPDVTTLIADLQKSLTDTTQSQTFFRSYSVLSSMLNGTEGPKTASLILARQEDLVPNELIRNASTAGTKPVTAAIRLLELTKSQFTISRTGKGHLVFGIVKVSDGKLEPDLILAQMVIQPDGWFCTEIADLKKPLSFRAAGYRALDAAIPAEGAFAELGSLTMQAVTDEETGSLRGQISFQGEPANDQFKALINYAVPPPNTTTGGYSPRRRWPQAQPFPISKDGQFEISGLTPGTYAMILSSPKHANYYKTFEVKTASATDTGTIVMQTTDLGFYIGRPTPKGGEFPWEKDIATARKRAAAEGKPMMIMMTATWCGPCKMLEKETLSNGWIQQFMKDFVVVQAYEEKAVEEQYNCSAYPTLVFTDKSGREVHRTVGFQPAIAFSGQIAKARNALNLSEDKDLKQLQEKGLVRRASVLSPAGR